MAYSSSSSTALLVLLLTILWCSVCSFEFQVGGSEGWVVPPPNDTNIYNDWASHNRFQVGDSIRFKYKKDSVMEVSEEGYKNCNSSHPNMFSNNGNTVFRFDHPGSFYFISGASGHCLKGQKMIVRVLTQEDSLADHAKSSAFRLAISPLQLSNMLFHFVFAFAASYVV